MAWLAQITGAPGAEAVIASAVPVYDAVGQAFGESLYASCCASTRGMGQTLVAIRGLLERNLRRSNSRYWLTWMLLTYHGNPYARLAHWSGAED